MNRNIKQNIIETKLVVVTILVLGLYIIFSGINNTYATPKNLLPTAQAGELQNAKSLKKHQIGMSKDEPFVCRGTNPFRQTLENTPDGNGFSISPASLNVANLNVSTDYVSCLTLINYAPNRVFFKLGAADIVAGLSDKASQDFSEPKQAGMWLRPAVNQLWVQGNERVDIPYIIRTPEKLPAGSVTAGLRVIRTSSGGVEATIAQRIYISSPGGKKAAPKISKINSTRLLKRKPGFSSYRVKYTLANPSEYVATIEPNLVIRGLGRQVAKKELPQESVLPTGETKHEIVVRGLPWIGIYHPTLSIKNDQAKTEQIKLPILLIVPPTPYTVALIIAVLLPIGWILWVWQSRRRAWQAYLADMEDDEAYSEYSDYEDS